MPGPDAQVSAHHWPGNSEHNTRISKALSLLLLYPELWYHITIQIKVGAQTGIEPLERDTLLGSYRLGVRI